MIEDLLFRLLREGMSGAATQLGVEGELPEPELLTPKQKAHGDFSSNAALALASVVNRPPREVAEAIRSAIPSADYVERIEVAGPGFLNFFVTNDWLYESLRDVARAGDAYGRSEPIGKRVQVEFVSANPTGPLTIGHARNAAIGDAIASLLEFTGWAVEREYYFNNAGGQMDRFGASVEARYLQALGVQAEVPEDGYHGDYVATLAKELKESVGDAYLALPPKERLVAVRDAAVERVLEWIDRSLDRFGVRFDVYRSERDLADKGEIDEAVERLRVTGHAYEKDGAIWFRSTEFGDDKDRVIVRSNGIHTYFGADCAYLIDKFARGFDHLIYVWGADHHGDVVRVRGAAQALGLDPDAVEILIYQWVSFLREGRPVPMSKRAGNFVTLDELIDEVGTDATRFTLLQFSNDTPMNFDIDEVRRQTMENPVYYVQYGHARIASILRRAEAAGVAPGRIDGANLSLLSSEPELDLLRAVADVPGQIRSAAELRAPNRLTHAAHDLAARFHRFYAECRVVSDDDELTRSRLWLCIGVKQVIANLLGLLGVSAPEKMDRDDG